LSCIATNCSRWGSAQERRTKRPAGANPFTRPLRFAPLRPCAPSAPCALDRDRDAIAELFAAVYGGASTTPWVARWRTFFMACAELFAWRGGDEWFVAHYLFEKRGG